jgi:hypothetical protein
MALDTSFFEQHQDAAQNQAAIDARYFNQAAAAASQHAASNEVLIWEWIVCIALIVSILIILEIWLKIPILKKIKMINQEPRGKQRGMQRDGRMGSLPKSKLEMSVHRLSLVGYITFDGRPIASCAYGRQIIAITPELASP